jgi:hypothetical protein
MQWQHVGPRAVCEAGTHVPRAAGSASSRSISLPLNLQTGCSIAILVIVNQYLW